MGNQENFDKQTLTEHLTELRSCLIISMAAIGAGFAIAYTCIRPIADWFFRPLVRVLPDKQSLIFISYQEGFFFI
ncbi:twin-arginine translocase subunit TatC [Desulfogranum marinum]|uniref:twin-arginine translocase subunit TatC n=1 Tax=Desulfogranum marinum TaxID=453220 RepID=UPI0019645E07|nr:twin-arginine translocase subunit TatC [Desulfogranum marinum]MBM9510835.1 twin-arginine translocase subunit TatC [Desulfogranum marinum]